jgi:hypothetical protein
LKIFNHVDSNKFQLKQFNFRTGFARFRMRTHHLTMLIPLRLHNVPVKHFIQMRGERLELNYDRWIVQLLAQEGKMRIQAL